MLNNWQNCSQLKNRRLLVCNLCVSSSGCKCANFFFFFPRERAREGNINWVSLTCPKPRMCPAQESNQWPFGLRDDTQPTEPHQSGQVCKPFIEIVNLKSFLLKFIAEQLKGKKIIQLYLKCYV